MYMNFLSIMVSIIKLSYDTYTTRVFSDQNIYSESAFLPIEAPRKFFLVIKFMDMIVLLMASITFISRMAAMAPGIFGALTEYLNFAFNSRIMQTVLFSFYLTFSVAVFSSYIFAHYQLKVDNKIYSLVRTLLLFINGFYF